MTLVTALASISTSGDIKIWLPLSAVTAIILRSSSGGLATKYLSKASLVVIWLPENLLKSATRKTRPGLPWLPIILSILKRRVTRPLSSFLSLPMWSVTIISPPGAPSTAVYILKTRLPIRIGRSWVLKMPTYLVIAGITYLSPLPLAITNLTICRCLMPKNYWNSQSCMTMLWETIYGRVSIT